MADQDNETNQDNQAQNPSQRAQERSTTQTADESRQQLLDKHGEEKDILQRKREEVAEKGLAHASMNNGQALNPEQLSEAEVAGDPENSANRNANGKDTRPGTADVSDISEVARTNTTEEAPTGFSGADVSDQVNENGTEDLTGAGETTGSDSSEPTDPNAEDETK